MRERAKNLGQPQPFQNKNFAPSICELAKVKRPNGLYPMHPHSSEKSQVINPRHMSGCFLIIKPQILSWGLDLDCGTNQKATVLVINVFKRQGRKLFSSCHIVINIRAFYQTIFIHKSGTKRDNGKPSTPMPQI